MPLNVLPSMTKPPVAGSRAPRWMLESLPRAPPGAPLDGEHDQIEGVHRLDLEPARAAPAGLVRRGQRLGHHPFVAGGQRARRETAAPRRRSTVIRRSTRCCGRHDARRARRRRSAGRRVEQVDAVEVQHVEEEHRQRLCGACRRPRRPTAAEPRRGDLEAVRAAPSGRSAIASPSAIRSRHRQRQRRLDDLGQPVGDVVEAAGVDR